MNRYEWVLAGLIVITIIAGALVHEYRGAPVDANLVITHNDPRPETTTDNLATEEPTAAPSPANSPGEVDEWVRHINQMSLEDLKSIPGVGDVLAQRIASARPFRQMPDLLNVEGIGSHRMETIELHLRTHSPPPAPTQAVYAAPTRITQPLAPSGPVSLNRATREQLMAVSGIGATLADLILQERMNRGPRGFRSWNQVDQISGIGPSRLKTLQDHFLLPE